jgi:hypothetical protein
MDCPPSFDVVMKKLEIRAREGAVVVLSHEKLRALVRGFLELVQVDEEWYRSTYPDVAEGIANGTVPSAKDHFIHDGYFEGRLPHDVEIDDVWYYETYPDVAANFKAGGPSAKEHYLEHGYREGRSPVPPAAASSSMLRGVSNG